jgi:3-methyladenine DNA glycosylase Tag
MENHAPDSRDDGRVESDAFGRDLKQRGFSFAGSTVIYGHTQAVGMVNDHLIDCFRYHNVCRLGIRGLSTPDGGDQERKSQM